MADLFTKAMFAAYDEAVQAMPDRPRFLQGFFGKNPREIVRSDTEKLEIDSLRAVRGIALDVKRESGDVRVNNAGLYTSKEFIAPLYNEKGAVTAAMINKRLPRANPYDPINRMMALLYWVSNIQANQSLKIYRAMELQAAQALTTGIVLLSNGISLDWGKKASHTVTPAIKWDQANSTPLDDIEGLAEILRADGMMMPDTVIMGRAAAGDFIANAQVQGILNINLIIPGRLAPGTFAEGAMPWGRLTLGSFVLDFYIYPDSYADPATGVDTPYVTADSVIVFNKSAYLPKGFAAVEMLPQVEDLYREYGMPPVPQAQQGDIVPYAYPEWPTALWAGVQSAPVMCPSAIDTIGTLVNVDT